ncbi:MAG: hypothetical protein AMJ60_00710 [Desulfobacterales bacterium SG8_35]|nr:MAG: hypothetical protein AMJ60_00710 [Desulfobacterales bacterium SG8_35]
MGGIEANIIRCGWPIFPHGIPGNYAKTLHSNKRFTMVPGNQDRFGTLNISDMHIHSLLCRIMVLNS